MSGHVFWKVEIKNITAYKMSSILCLNLFSFIEAKFFLPYPNFGTKYLQKRVKDKKFNVCCQTLLYKGSKLQVSESYSFCEVTETMPKRSKDPKQCQLLASYVPKILTHFKLTCHYSFSLSKRCT